MRGAVVQMFELPSRAVRIVRKAAGGKDGSMTRVDADRLAILLHDRAGDAAVLVQ